MRRNHAIRIHAYGGGDALRFDEIALPLAGPGEVVVRVRASSVNPVDWKVCSGQLKAMFPESLLPLVPGADLAGTIDQLGAGVSAFAIGDAVYGMVGLVGAYAQYVCIKAELLAAKPRSLDFLHAAAVPLAGLTAWQALFEAAQLQAGQSLLIHAGAGGVGSLAVQLAHGHGARVTATASAANADYLRSLGADEVIDYRSTTIEAMAQDYDVVLDLVGGDTAERSRGLLKPGGIVVVVAGRPAPSAADALGRRIVGIVVRPDGGILRQLAQQLDAGQLKPTIAARFPIREVAAAHALSAQNHTRGKIVLEMDT
jgi:NADPH:quinone reductase-like Zn-dependent oxidoreductase